MTNPWDNQPPPGDPGPPGYFPPPYTGYPPPMYPAHPQSTTALVLGVVGLVLCGFASPFAIWLGRKSMREIDASGGRLGGRGQALAGFILGIVGTAFLVIAVSLVVTGVLGAVLSSSNGV